MCNRNIFKLSPRLMCCAEMIKSGSRIVDVGTDHAYLPIWLSKKNIISYAIACDINMGPLEVAKKNIDTYKVKNVETRLSNGLKNINESEVDTVIIAGMGGELIFSIIEGVPWVKNKMLILQPMSSERDLRISLYESNYKINKEVAIKSYGKVYTVMEVMYNVKENRKYDKLYPFLGEILKDENNINADTFEYIHKQLKDIEKRKKGEETKKNYKMALYYNNIINEINNIIVKYGSLR